jgi:DNA primase
VDKVSSAKMIKSRVALSSIVKNAVKLKGTGPNFVGLCPFHQEKTPSFHVRDQKERFKCFGCGISGDHFEFLMRLRGISFIEAMQELALVANVDINLPELVTKQIEKPDEDLLRAQRIAQEFFLKQLTHIKCSSAFNYLVKKRGLSPKMIEQALLGFGGFNKDDFLLFLKKHNISEKLALEAGLVRQGRYSLIPQFLGRITFPIRDLSGKIIAFAGRSYQEQAEEGPKYINTHKYKLYEKRENFYGLFETKAAILKGLPPVLVEGYFDAMAFWALGLPALALCGTALSSKHAAILQRLSKRIILCFDSDNAGIAALKSSLIELFSKNIVCQLIILDKKDPGSYLSDNRLLELKSITAKPVDALCFLIDQAILFAQNDVRTRIEQIDALLPVLAQIKRPLVRRQYVAYLAKNLHEDSVLLWSEVEQRIKGKKRTDDVKKRINLPQLSSDERLLIQIVFSAPLLIIEALKLRHFLSSWAEEVFLLVAENIDVWSHKKDIAKIKAAVVAKNEDKWSVIEEILYNRVELSLDEASSALMALENKFNRKEIKEILKKKRMELQDLEKKGDFSSILQGLREHSTILMSNKPVPISSVVKSKDYEKKEMIIKVNEVEDLDDEPLFNTDECWL